METVLKDERLDNTGFGRLKIIQNPREFCYGVDAVILSDFAAGRARSGESIPGKRIRNAMDLGTGNGIIPLVLSHKTAIKEIYGLEVQESAYLRAKRNIAINDLSDRITIFKGDVADYMLKEGRELHGTFDMVLTNPPYVAKGGGIANHTGAKFIARQETTAGIEDFISTASKLLKDKGDFFMVHRPSRLADIVIAMHENSIEPKEMRFVSPNVHKAPNILLIHGVKGGGRELKILDPLYIYSPEGDYSEEINAIYER